MTGILVDVIMSKVKSKSDKKRSENWTEDELTALIDAISPNYDILCGALSNSITADIKHKLWLDIAIAVNSASIVTRSVAECKDKFINFKCRCKKKAIAEISAIKLTGGGTLTEDAIVSDLENIASKLSLSEIKVTKLLGSASLFGLKSTFDPLAPSHSAIEDASESTKDSVTIVDVTINDNEDSSDDLSAINKQLPQKRKRGTEDEAKSVVSTVEEQSLVAKQRIADTLDRIESGLNALVEIEREKLALKKLKYLNVTQEAVFANEHHNESTGPKPRGSHKKMQNLFLW